METEASQRRRNQTGMIYTAIVLCSGALRRPSIPSGHSLRPTACSRSPAWSSVIRAWGGHGFAWVIPLTLAIGFLPLDGLAILREVNLEGVNVLIEAQRAHRPKDVFAIDGLALLLLTLIASLGGDEAYEF